MMQALSSSETSVLTRASRRNIPEDAILQSHLRENLRSHADLGGSPFGTEKILASALGPNET
jgi:hypothetical protein